eukprot:scaffold154722_cov36-Cyclotella_meneghiniana.AAC.7
MKFPEVNFMDCAGRVNRQKRDLFLSVIHSPEGICHLSNVSIMLSGKAWVFHYILKYVYQFLYGPITLIFYGNKKACHDVLMMGEDRILTPATNNSRITFISKVVNILNILLKFITGVIDIV